MGGHVYSITNIENNKMYVGSTVEYEKRKRAHLNGLRGSYHDNRKLQEDFNIYGEDAFKFNILHEAQTEEERFNVESDIIQSLGTYKNGYNLSVDGRGRYIITEATREKMRENTIGENNPFYGKTHSEETIEILSEKASKRTGEANSFYGKKHSEEAKERMRHSWKELRESGWIDPQKGVPKTEEEKKKNMLSQPNRKPVHAEGKVYQSMSECSKDLGIVITTVRNRIKNENYPDYYYLDK